MERRRFLFASLTGMAAAGLGTTAAVASGLGAKPTQDAELMIDRGAEMLGAAPAPNDAEDLLEDVQYYGGRRRRRCWLERRRVWFRDRWGRPHARWVTREVCR